MKKLEFPVVVCASVVFGVGLIVFIAAVMKIVLTAYRKMPLGLAFFIVLALSAWFLISFYKKL